MRLKFLLPTLLFVMSLFFSEFASAGFNQPTHLSESKKPLDCLATTSDNDYAIDTYDTPFRASDARQSVIKIFNNCSVRIVITDIRSSKIENEAAESKNSYSQIKVNLRSEEKYQRILLTKDGNDCSQPFPSGPVTRITCKSISMPPRSTLTVPMPRDYFFSILGHAEISIEGQIR